MLISFHCSLPSLSLSLSLILIFFSVWNYLFICSSCCKWSLKIFFSYNNLNIGSFSLSLCYFIKKYIYKICTFQHLSIRESTNHGKSVFRDKSQIACLFAVCCKSVHLRLFFLRMLAIFSLLFFLGDISLSLSLSLSSFAMTNFMWMVELCLACLDWRFFFHILKMIVSQSLLRQKK